MKKKVENCFEGGKDGSFFVFFRHFLYGAGASGCLQQVLLNFCFVITKLYSVLKQFHKGMDGGGAVIMVDWPETGCAKVTLRAWRQIEPSGFERGEPYFRSPFMGQPMAASWDLI